MVELTTSVTKRGPLLDGKDGAVIERFLDDAVKEVAQQGLANVHMYLNASIKHSTPYYETQITIQRVGTTNVVHDRGIVYGPWLEGTSPMNARTSFKGYHSFRKAKQKTQTEVSRLVMAVMRRYLGRL